MKTSDFNFDLPESLIARYPLENRTESRLLCLNQQGEMSHTLFSQLPQLLKKNDLLVFNNTRVIPARLFAKKLSGGKVEILVERILENNFALVHLKANKALKLPCQLWLENDVSLIAHERCNDLFKVEFQIRSDSTIHKLLDEVGSVPLPHYLQRKAEQEDKERYQTVYAQSPGAVAAPTAGLHFDESLLTALQENGINLGFITLHVGAGTFKPVTVEEIVQHCMHSEIFEIDEKVCELIQQTKKVGGRVIAVGTTTVRALETAARNQPKLSACSGETSIFIYPGYRFNCVDGLITNFHLPKSTLLMLVCAFGGYERVMQSYQTAINEQYRFYSYGDAMFLTNESD